jgi:hypothetical protein
MSNDKKKINDKKIAIKRIKTLFEWEKNRERTTKNFELKSEIEKKN